MQEFSELPECFSDAVWGAEPMTRLESNTDKKEILKRPGILVTLIILLIVLLSGYLVMALEILAFRIVQIYFGSEIYATGAVLGVVLAALTVGYWLGGTLSVRLRPTGIQATALVIAGLWIFMMGGIPSPVSGFFEPREDPMSVSEPFLRSAI